LAHASLSEHSYKRLQLAPLPGQPLVLLTLVGRRTQLDEELGLTADRDANAAGRADYKETLKVGVFSRGAKAIFHAPLYIVGRMKIAKGIYGAVRRWLYRRSPGPQGDLGAAGARVRRQGSR
jgi:hypothetical protein